MFSVALGVGRGQKAGDNNCEPRRNCAAHFQLCLPGLGRSFRFQGLNKH